jgi:hypothetical protein
MSGIGAKCGWGALSAWIGMQKAPRPRISRRLIVAVGAALFIAASGPVPADAKPKLKLKRIGRFHNPVYATSAPGVGGIFVVEQGGRIRHVQGKRRRTFLKISGLVRSGGERGLLSVAFSPDYASSRLLYVYFTNRAGDIEIAELRADPDGLHAATSTLRPVLIVPHPGHSNHNGGQLRARRPALRRDRRRRRLGRRSGQRPGPQLAARQADPDRPDRPGEPDHDLRARTSQSLPVLLRSGQRAGAAANRDRRRRRGPVRGDRLSGLRRRQWRELRLERLRGLRAVRGRPSSDRQPDGEADQGLPAQREGVRDRWRLRGSRPAPALAVPSLRLWRLLRRVGPLADPRSGWRT